MTRFIPLLFLTLVLSSCKTYTEDDKTNFDKQISDYLKKHSIACDKSESGLYYHIYTEGSGNRIQFTDDVSFTYKGTLLNGTVFDIQKKPVAFNVKELIAGWKEIMLKIKPGAKVFLAIPPHLGYGDHDLEKIPKNSILLFEMEIDQVK